MTERHESASSPSPPRRQFLKTTAPGAAAQTAPGAAPQTAPGAAALSHADRIAEACKGKITVIGVLIEAATLGATADQDWVTDPNTYKLGDLLAGDRIYFALDRADRYWYDATEIAWHITAS